MAGTGLQTQRDLAPYRAYHTKRFGERLERREKRRERCLAAARDGIRLLAPAFPPIRAVYLFGSVLRPGPIVLEIAWEMREPFVKKIDAFLKFVRGLRDNLD